ncbi:MAG: hypothetical protein AAF950_07125 [Pseudomonadota bacterium]
MSIDDFRDSLGESNSAYSYVPIDPFSVKEGLADSCKENEGKLLSLPEAFPDNNVRIAYKTFDLGGKVSFGPVETTQKGYRYQIIVDYINVDVANEKFFARRFEYINGRLTQVGLFDKSYDDGSTSRSGYVEIDRGTQVPKPGGGVIPAPQRTRSSGTNLDNKDTARSSNQTWNVTTPTVVNVPVYVGVGLRVIADVIAIKGKSNLSGLDAISLAAENGQVTGSLTVQTLGINGKAISSTLPIQSELNRTTVQNAIAALGAIKALMYDDEVRIEPRVVGIYNPIGGGEEIVNSLISALSSERVEWKRPCASEHK